MSKALNRFFRTAALVVTDRRWAAPLSAMALGFGLFIGVAIGPSASGTFAGTAQVIEVPDFRGGTSADEDDGGGGGSAAPVGPIAGGGGGGGLGESLAPVPLAPSPIESEPAAPEPRPSSRPPTEEEEPGTEETQDFEGIVVQANPAARSYALAIKGGELISVHAAELPDPGEKLSLTAKPLQNSTFAEAEAPKSRGRSKRASFRGAVTFIDADAAAPVYTVSGRGASILVRVRPDPAGAPAQFPALGSYATVTVDIEAPPAQSTPAIAPVSPACAPDLSLPALKPIAPLAHLWQGEMEVEGEPSTYVDLTGIVTAICPDRLTISADGTRESERDLELTVPSDIEIGSLDVGDSIVATATIEEGGALTLAGLAGDEGARGADDPSFAQGDLKR